MKDLMGKTLKTEYSAISLGPQLGADQFRSFDNVTKPRIPTVTNSVSNSSLEVSIKKPVAVAQSAPVEPVDKDKDPKDLHYMYSFRQLYNLVDIIAQECTIGQRATSLEDRAFKAEAKIDQIQKQMIADA
jgi:hypothetical protein